MDNPMFFTNNFIRRKLVFIWLVLISTTVLSSEQGQHDNVAERTQAAKRVTQQFLKQFGGQLKKEWEITPLLKRLKCIKTLHLKSQMIYHSQTAGVLHVYHTKPRDALLGTPDMLERETLASFKSRENKEESYEDMTKAEVIDEAGKSYFRFMKPIAIKPVCHELSW
jgi:hypothetical protein